MHFQDTLVKKWEVSESALNRPDFRFHLTYPSSYTSVCGGGGGGRLGRERENELSPPYSLSTEPSLNYTQHSCTGPAEHWCPQGRC